jgi:MATE family multidrug resistance protein
VEFKEHLKRNFVLAWPVMLGQAGHVLVGLADSIMIGRVGTEPLAAGAFGNSIFIVPLVFGLGMAMGLTTPIANADGEKDVAKAGRYLRHGLLTNMLTGLVMFMIILGLVPFMDQLGQDKAVETLARPYLLIISGSILPLMFFLTFKQFAEGLSDTRVAMYVSLGANFLNIFLNYLLIYGKWGLPEMGLFGAGLATLISRIIMAIIMYAYIMKADKFAPYRIHFSDRIWRRDYVKKLLNIGIPSGLQYIFEVSSFAVAAVLIGQIAAEALAAHQIAISLAALSYMMATGIAAAAGVRVGNQLGARKYLIMRTAGRSCLVMVFVFMATCGVLFFAGRNLLPTFYTEDLEVIAIASQLLFIAVFFQISDGVQVVALGALRGMSEVKIPTLITFISYWILGLLPAYIFGIVLNLGVQGIWYGLATGLTAAAALLYLRFEWKSKQLINHEVILS